MPRSNRSLTAIRAALFFVSVSVLTVGAGSVEAAPAPTATDVPTTVTTAQTDAPVVQPDNERWD